MATITTTQQLVLDGAQRRAAEASEAAFAHGRQHGWPIPEALLEASLKAENTVIRLRGSIIGTGTWTEDGGPVVGQWHEGPEHSGVIRYERYELGVRTAHGYVDPISRRIAQVG